MRTRRVIAGPLQTNCWIVDDGEGGPLIVIDPASDALAILDEVGPDAVAWVVLTHGHFDHLGAVREILAAAGGRLAVHAADATWITSSVANGGAMFGFEDTAPPADRELREGDIVVAGSLELEVVHTPGHTPGSICLLGQDHLFSGDTLFAGSVGRTDFPRGDEKALLASIGSKLAPLPDKVAVHPGHGPDTTIGRERRVNPFFPRA